MNIVLYVPMWPPKLAPNGIVTYASTLVPALRRLGHTVHIITPIKTGADSFATELIQSSPIEKMIARFIRAYSEHDSYYYTYTRRILRTLRQLADINDIDIIEMEESFGWCAAISEMSSFPVVVRLHGPWFMVGSAGNMPLDTPANQSRLKREGDGVALAAGVSAPSHYVLKASVNYYRQQYANTSIIPNAIEQFDDDYLWKEKNADWNRLIFVGRFDLIKGADIVLEAFAILAAKLPKLVLDFVGPDTGVRKMDGTNINFGQYLTKFVDQNIADRITYHGVLDRHEIDVLRRKACITIVASRNEVFGYTALEALSLGCPTVATAVGGVQELVISGKTGLLVEKSDPRAMADACVVLLSDKALASRLGRSAVLATREKFNSTSIAAQTVDFYHNLIDS
ncbi:MAG: glycosyltransferase family 4 protein [Paracoccaceae bacterium]